MENKKIQKAKGVIENKILERIMRELSRAIVYKDGGCREVKDCGECDSYKIYRIGKKNGKDVYNHICNELHRKLQCDPESKSIQIENFIKILDNCPLSFYDRMRWHDAKRELPENFLNVAVKMLKDGKVVYGTGLATRDGTWVADGIFIDGIVKIEILEWRYYE